MSSQITGRAGGSFRDPAGFVFYRDGKVYRQINLSYQKEYDYLIACGLYEELVQAGLLIRHTELQETILQGSKGYKIIQPEPVPFISYPYEWCFDQLKDAALLTLQIQKHSLQFGMSLKDASAYNVQFLRGKPIFIDTLSFETFQEGSGWVAYRQFCQHFLAPLALMSYTDLSLSQLLRINLDGIPLSLASNLLPIKTYFSFGILSHIHLHAKTQQKYAGKPVAKTGSISKKGVLAIITNLEIVIKNLKPRQQQTEWQHYYTSTNYTSEAENHKARLITEFITETAPGQVWDLGGNTGKYSRLASQQSVLTLCLDLDPLAVNFNYNSVKEKEETYLLPLLMDITNPSGAIGWANAERLSLTQRGPADLLMALALIHHLVIGANIPLIQVARYFSSLGHYLVIEFVPKSDSQVQRLLATRPDIYADYTILNFERIFKEHFTIQSRHEIAGSERVLYLMQKI